MSHHAIPLNELAVAVQSAVEEVLGKHGAVPIEKLWVGFVAPDALANEEAAGELAARLGKEGGVHGQPSVAQQVVSVGAGGRGGEEVKPQLQKQIRIIGLMYSPQLKGK
jgi:hypothetical protein